MLIDTNDEELVQKFEYLKKELQLEKEIQDEYTSEEIMLVRVTEHLPENGVIKSISNIPFVIKTRSIAYQALQSILEEQGLDYEDVNSQALEYTPCSTQYRSTIHFCLNGIVSSHMQGNFEGRPFVIIEPFSEHENDTNLLTVRGEDTYFKNEIKLSDKATILVDERYAEKILDSDVKDKYKIVYYRGDQELAVHIYLTSIGIVPQRVGKDYLIENETAELIRNFIIKKGYNEDKHCYSESYKKDDENNLILWEKYDRMFFEYLYTRIYGNIENRQEEINVLSKGWITEKTSLPILINLIKIIGIDKYKQIVSDYNSLIFSQLESGKYPTNNQILEGVKIDFSEQKDRKI